MPPRAYVGVFLWRTSLIWCAAHVLSRSLSAFTFRAFALALAVTVTLLLVDMQRRSERRFLANLGVSRLTVIAVVAIWFSLLEVALILIVGGPSE